MGAIASQITSLTVVYSTVCSDAEQRKHQSSASLAFVRGIHRGPVNPPHKWPVTRKMFPFDYVIMETGTPNHQTPLGRTDWCIYTHFIKKLGRQYELIFGDEIILHAASYNESFKIIVTSFMLSFYLYKSNEYTTLQTSNIIQFDIHHFG